MATLQNWHRTASGLIIPVNGIFGIDTSDPLPSTLAEYTAPGGRCIYGASGDGDIGDTGGSHTISGSTPTSGAHGTTYENNGSINVGYPNEPNPTQLPLTRATEGAHAHGWSASYYPARCSARLVQAQSDIRGVPAGAILFSGPDSLENMSAYSYFNNHGGLLGQHTSNLIVNASGSGSISSASDWHDHVASVTGGHYEIYPAYQWHGGGGGSHSHSWSPSFSSFSPSKATLVAWKASEVIRKSVGAPIIMYDQPGYPDKWSLCDGTNGTPDLRSCFIGFGAAYSPKSGSNTIYVSGATGSASHNHSYTNYQGTVACTAIGHSSLVAHSHSVAELKSYVPPYYKLKFIMFTG